jgi:3-hydroxyisobutyrate dehydrogenase-like beta-hydroxyacid dehydrogenase
MGDNEMTTSVGWIGAGRMGYALIERLLEAGYDGMAAVELSRDSHRGAWAAEESLKRILSALPNGS